MASVFITVSGMKVDAVFFVSLRSRPAAGLRMKHTGEKNTDNSSICAYIYCKNQICLV